MLVIESINVYTDVFSVSMSQLNVNHQKAIQIYKTEVYFLLPDGSVSDGIQRSKCVNNISPNSIIFLYIYTNLCIVNNKKPYLYQK